MSSGYVRTTMKNFITTELPTEFQIDFSGEYREINSMLNFYGLSPHSPFLGIQFIPSIEAIRSVATNNTQGCYRELGAVYLHIVEPVKKTLEHRDNIITRADSIMAAFRGQRFSSIVVEDVSPVNFEAGATLQFEAGYDSGVVIVNFYRDNNL